MANIVVTNCDTAQAIALKDEEFRQETVTFAGADTFAKGTILARREVNLTPTAVKTGTGNGTCTALSVIAGPNVPRVGAYVLTCIEAVTHGGVFKLVDPAGQLVDGYLPMTAGSGGATVLNAGGIQFTLTDGSTDFIVGDYFTITVAADGKLVPYSLTGAGGVQVPCAVLTYDLVATGSGDLAARVLVSGVVKKNRLIIDADGDDTNVSAHVIDLLRERSIVAVNVKQLGAYDNYT